MQFPDVTQVVATMVSGKLKVVKALSAGIELNHLGDPKASLDDVMKEYTFYRCMLWAEVKSIRHNVFSPLQSMGITYWAKVGQYPSETKVTAAYCGSL